MIQKTHRVYSSNVRLLESPFENPVFFQAHHDLLETVNSDREDKAEAQIALLNLYNDYREMFNFNGVVSLVTIPEDRKVYMLEFDGVIVGNTYPIGYDESLQRHYLEL